MPSHPSATILVLNFNGRAHLEQCLPSLERVEYPGTFDVTVIDNGSTDGSREFVARRHPRARVLALGANRGFATAYNIAVRQATADVVVLLNNDTRVREDWLSALVGTLERHGAAAAASLMLDWEGRRVDFAGGLPTFVGHAWQVDHGQPVGRAYEERPLLFGCAGSLAVRRHAFLEAGGFDDDYFAYFEDLDLGWRMSLAGQTTVLAPQAITQHRLHGTAAGWGLTLRLRLYERNALFTLYKNYGDEALARVLPAAIALTLARALADSGLDDSALAFGRAAPAHLALPPRVVATLLALEDFARALPRLREKRRLVQARRRVSDDDLFALFPEPLRLHDLGDRYRDAADALIRDLGIAEVFGLAPPRLGGAGAVGAGVTRSQPFSPVAPPAAVATDGRHPVRAGVVSVVVLTASGPRHLPDCLDSLRAHRWPADRTEVIVVDNGSAEDPSPTVARHYPGARVIRTGANLGFSGGNNAGAAAAGGEWLVFLNDDTRVAPGWLDELVGVAERRGAASVGAFILDWAGERVDFAGGLVNFEGRGYSQGYDLPAAEADRRERPLLFGCGAAVLFRRDVFEESGGWDTPTFAYYEDVEFGWRLWMLGHEVWFAPEAVVYHRHHGTSGAESPARVRAFERNALRMIYSLLDPVSLREVLPAALLLAADRALLGTPFSRADEGVARPGSWAAARARLHPRVVAGRLRQALGRRGARRQYGLLGSLWRVGLRGLAGALREVAREVRDGWDRAGARADYLLEGALPHALPDGRHEVVPASVVAQLVGIRDFLHLLPATSARRAWLQAKRRRSDAEILARFGGCWTEAVPSPRLDLHLALRAGMLDALPGPRPVAEPEPVTTAGS